MFRTKTGLRGWVNEKKLGKQVGKQTRLYTSVKVLSRTIIFLSVQSYYFYILLENIAKKPNKH